MLKTLRLETTAPFQGLAELVAYDEGLFAQEGLEIEWIERGQKAPRNTDTSVTTPEGLSAFASHGSSFEAGAADMYNACEWGNYRRVQDTAATGRQLGRRSIVVYAGLVVRPESEVFTPQQLAGKLVGVPYFFGTHYLALLMLEGFIPRELIKTCRAPNGSAARYEAMLSGEIEATTLTEPFLTAAEKRGCRTILMAPYTGTEVASDDVDADTYAAFNRAVHEAVRRIKADKNAYLHYFLDKHRHQHADIAALNVEDLSASRLQVINPGPIPDEELVRSREWMQTWDMLDAETEAESLISRERQEEGHRRAGL